MRLGATRGAFHRRGPVRVRWPGGVLACVLALALLGACSIRQMALDTLGDALAGGGSAYTSDADVALIGDALPFSLKLLDSLIAESPRHRGLLLAGSRAYLLYAYGFVGDEADRLARDDVDRSNLAHERARDLAMRAFEYATRGLELRYPAFASRLGAEPATAAKVVDDAGDVDLLHAAAASLALAIGHAKSDAAMLARIAEVDALLAQALALDDAWDDGALHELALSWRAARPGPFRRDEVDAHYARALDLSRGTRAALFVAYAEAVAVREQDRRLFVGLVDRALAVDLEARPDERLQNALAQRRARRLAAGVDRLFVE